MPGFNGLHYEIHSASRHRGTRSCAAWRPQWRADKTAMVNDPSPMGGHPFLFGTSFCGFDDFAYHSALELDKELFQIAPKYRAKNNRRLTGS